MFLLIKDYSLRKMNKNSREEDTLDSKMPYSRKYNLSNNFYHLFPNQSHTYIPHQSASVKE